jgi:SAM-dependent methyltransferase
VFHEVRSQPDKLKLVREALRVLKPGGSFVFEDVFFAKSHYGDIQEFVKALEPYVAELHFVDMRRPDYAPAFLNTPLVLGQMGLIYGRNADPDFSIQLKRVVQ